MTKTLLLLGSKPDPVLPPASSWDALACANASGRSANNLGLQDPEFTVISAILTSGKKPANDLAVANLTGLHTQDLFFLPRPIVGSNVLKRALFPLRMWRCMPWYFQRHLAGNGYHWDRFHNPGYAWYLAQLQGLCGSSQNLQAVIASKQPSTGVFALAVALASQRWDRIILAGFSFELTHAYAHNPSIDSLGTTRSKHADTDIQVIQALSKSSQQLLTTELAVAAATGLPYL